MGRIQLLYALACAIWAAYLIRILAPYHLAHPNAKLSGALYCFLAIVVVPGILGYLLLFKAFPRLSRRIGRQPPDRRVGNH